MTQSTKDRREIGNDRVHLEVRMIMTAGGTLVNRRRTSGPVCQKTNDRAGARNDGQVQM
jgi:hypothetical protein